MEEFAPISPVCPYWAIAIMSHQTLFIKTLYVGHEGVIILLTIHKQICVGHREDGLLYFGRSNYTWYIMRWVCAPKKCMSECLVYVFNIHSCFSTKKWICGFSMSIKLRLANEYFIYKLTLFAQFRIPARKLLK